MTRNDFPAAVATAVSKITGLPVTPRHVRALAFDLWDTAQDMAQSEREFRAALIAGTKGLATALVEVA